jgi:hypothetical protein
MRTHPCGLWTAALVFKNPIQISLMPRAFNFFAELARRLLIGGTASDANRQDQQY